MRISIVPAQITTVEDKIAGNISIQQAALLGIPILFGFVVALVFPPSGQFVAYKITIVAILFAICGSLAIRIKGRIVAKWIKLFAIYSARPRYYIYDKNTSYLRDDQQDSLTATETVETTSIIKKPKLQAKNIAAHEFARLEQLALDARASMKFEVGKKGELNVRITEVE
jgi:hypothetical protein